MNNCTFTGYLVEDPVLSKDAESVNYLNFQLVTYMYRKTKTGEKNRIPTFLNFEAWASGAETIAKLARRGTKLTVVASARNVSKEDDRVIFRVNEFDFACLDDKGRDA